MNRLHPVFAAAGMAALLAACAQPQPRAVNQVSAPPPAPVAQPMVVAPQPLMVAPATVVGQPVVMPPGTVYVAAPPPTTVTPTSAKPGHDCLKYKPEGMAEAFWCVGVTANGDLYTGDWGSGSVSYPVYSYQKRYNLAPRAGATGFAINCNGTNWCVGSDNMGGTYSGDALLTATDPGNPNAFRRRT